MSRFANIYRFATIFLLPLMLCVLLTACHKRIDPTDIRILDIDRHYYPVVQGEDVRMSYVLINDGKHPLVISDIQPASLHIELAKEAPRLIPAGDSARLCFVFHTDRNVGLTEHKIRLFANIESVNGLVDSLHTGVVVIRFDIPIVRPSLDGSDYEEHYYAKRPPIEIWVDGTRGEQGYYTDEDIAERAAQAAELSE